MLFFTKTTCKKNKFLKKEICHKLDTVILQIKQGDHNSFFGEEIVRKWINELNDLKAMLDGCICTDKNDMGIVAEAISEDMKSITKVVHTTSPAKVEREIGILEKHVLKLPIQ